MSQKKNVNDWLVESYNQVAPNGVVKSKERLQEIMSELDLRVQDREWDLTKDLDYKHIFEKAMPEGMFKLFQKSGNINSREEANRLTEEAEVVIKASYFDQFIDRCITRQMLQFSCDMSPMVLKPLTTRVEAPCSQYSDSKICEWPMDPPPDFCELYQDDEQPAKFYGLGDMRCWRLPKPKYISFSFALHRNLVCVDPNGEVRRQVEERAKWFDIIDEKSAAALMFDIKGACSNAFTYSYDGTTYASGWKGAGAGAPWTNVIESTAMRLTGCSEAPLIAIEQMFDDMVDPYNCFPVDCGGGYKLVLTRDAKKYPYQDLIAPKSITKTLADVCDAAQVVDRQQREGWDPNPIISKWAFKELVKFYMSGKYVDLGSTTRTYNEEDAIVAAENTYLVSKGLGQTFGFMVDFDVSTRELSGTNTWQYFDRGVTWARRYERKANFIWLKPWLTLLVRSFNLADPSAG